MTEFWLEVGFSVLALSGLVMLIHGIRMKPRSSAEDGRRGTDPS